MNSTAVPGGLVTRGWTAAAVAGGAVVFLLASAALLNGMFAAQPLPAELRRGAVVAHLVSVMAALPLGVAQLLLPKGTFRHRTVGYLWCTLMVFTSLVSFAIHGLNPRGLSPIHLFSVLTLVFVPLIILNARAGRVAAHRRAALGLMTGGLVIAGLFTFAPGRVLGEMVGRLFR